VKKILMIEEEAVAFGYPATGAVVTLVLARAFVDLTNAQDFSVAAWAGGSER
jgi:hypothetical protein